MKTSLIIDDPLFNAAQKEALKNKTTVSQTLSFWAKVGREVLAQKKWKPASKRILKTVDLGGPALIDLSSRKDWRDILDQE